MRVPVRFMDPTYFAPAEEALGGGDGEVVIQFSTPPAGAVLEAADDLARRFGDRVEVRFYGHYGPVPFDLATLRSIPHASSLSLDCLDRATGIEFLRQREGLKRLQLSIARGMPKDLLTYPSLRNLERLTIAAGIEKAVDLRPLAEYRRLRDLFIGDLTIGIEAVGEVERLEVLSLSKIGRKTALGFVSKLRSLREFSILLGGRESLNEIENPSIEKLSVIRVQGLSDLGLHPLPSLTTLEIQDQIRLQSLAFAPANANLRSLRILNCKSFASLSGLHFLENLESLRFYGTALDLDRILAAPLPKRLEKFAFFTGRRSRDTAIAEKLRALGYDPT